MELKKLEQHIRTLATVQETDSPLISCYLELKLGPAGYREVWNSRTQLIRSALPARSLEAFEHAATRVEGFLNQAVAAGARAVAVFSRAGQSPFWMSLQFEVPLPNWIAVGKTPNIYHLVELKDNYDRYVILLTTETSARIIGVNLGSVTEQLWTARPELRRRVGHEWTREHFEDHRRERAKQFVQDQIRSLEQVISAGGYGHLILAGNARMVAAVRRLLPKRLAAKLVDFVPASSTDRLSDIVASTLEAFLEREEQESQALAEKLISRIYCHGLAVAGTRASMNALKAGQADVLVLVKDYDPGKGWECRVCRKVDLDGVPPNRCPQCDAGQLGEFDIRGEMVRLAGQQQLGVEVVEHSDVLMNLGGVGCLLRYHAPSDYLYSAA